MNVPSRITQSLSSTNRVTSSRPIAPSYRPTYSGCTSLITLLPSMVAAIAMLRPFGQRQHVVLQAEAMNFDAGDDHGFLAAGNPTRRFFDRFAASASGSLVASDWRN